MRYTIKVILTLLMIVSSVVQPVFAKEIGKPYLSVDYSEENGELFMSGTLENYRYSSVVSVTIRRLNDDELIYMDDQKVKSDGSFELDSIKIPQEPGLKKYYISFFDGSQKRGFCFGNLLSTGCESAQLVMDIKSIPTEYLCEDISDIYAFFDYEELSAVLSDFEDDVKKDTIEYIREQLQATMTPSEMKEVLKSGVACAAVKKMYWVSAKSILNEKFKFDKEVDGYQSLTELQQDKLFRELSGKTYAAYKELVEAAKKYVSDIKKQETSKGGTGGGGGRVNSGSSSVMFETGAVGKENNINSSQAGIFNDLAGYEWAETAINSLMQEGIVNGFGNDKFEPGLNVTRAEFVKMAVELFAVEEGTEVPFQDVSDDDWYYPYVSRAYSAGLILGDGNAFNGNEYITRQDIAVILARRSGMVESDFNTSMFSDWGEVALYAQDAMKQLCSRGILNGYDGKLAPTQCATRAEAAVMIYNFKNKG